ncbi:DPP IV N-terminal domain-containing protein [Mucilaginibacter sp.]|jgi:dipeptidyl aminopeptidase/acylaminoacyl peptidase|uniref:S9 family peptidase n=1 Tax=Mucilaginibacter sp. TaxID=1882438 RepID=UPI003563C353
MTNYRFSISVLLTSLLTIISIASAYGQASGSITDENRYENYLKFYTLVRGANVRPHWYPDGNHFWFAGGTADSTVIYEVDPQRNTKTELFNTRRLRAALKQVLGHAPPNKGIPFIDFDVVNGTDTVQFRVESKAFRLNLKDYTITPVKASPEAVIRESQLFSPDRQQFIFVRDNNLWFGSTAKPETAPLTDDGIKDHSWNTPGSAWSPDGAMLFVKKSDDRKVHHLPVINYSKPAEEVEWNIYAKTGGALEITELFVVDVKTKRQVKIDAGKDTAQYIFPLGWRPDNSEVLFMRMTRQGNKLELLAADPHTGKSRVIVTEQQKTFACGLDFITEKWKRQFTLLRGGNTFIWLSERDGWKQLYLYDMGGKLIRRLTTGTFPVTGVIKADEKAGWIYFTANAETDLYATNLYRVSFDGKQFKKLTAASGSHDIQLSPSGKYFLDTHSSPNRPPSVELRSADGRLLQVLRKADTSQLNRIGFHAPESFIVKADDGSTDLYGILYKPFDFDPNKKYPVIEFIYGGPFMTIVPHGFMPGTSLAIQAQAMAQLGYITFLVDGRGTTERSKAFQDAVYGNIGKYEIPDHVAALKQLAAKRSFMDLTRVGIYGHSWGGYFALRAMLTAPDVYQVGIASAPGDLTEGAEINEPYIGLPQDNQAGYKFGTNTNLAGNLKGKLLFIHGTSDTNAPLSTTIRMVDALIKAGKLYDLLLLPGQTHFFEGVSENYANDAIRRYFDKNLK